MRYNTKHTKHVLTAQQFHSLTPGVLAITSKLSVDGCLYVMQNGEMRVMLTFGQMGSKELRWNLYHAFNILRLTKSEPFGFCIRQQYWYVCLSILRSTRSERHGLCSILERKFLTKFLPLFLFYTLSTFCLLVSSQPPQSIVNTISFFLFVN